MYGQIILLYLARMQKEWKVLRSKIKAVCCFTELWLIQSSFTLKCFVLSVIISSLFPLSFYPSAAKNLE